MSNYEETSDNLINELALLRQRVVDLEKQLENKSYPQSDTIAIAPQLSQQAILAQHYFDAAETFVVAVNINEQISFINRTGCEILGYEHDELIGKNWFDCFIVEDDRDQARANFHQLIRGEAENLAKFENPILSKSGEARIFEWYSTVIRDDNIIGTISAGQDITSRKQMEAKLQASEERYRNVVQHQTELICHYNLDFEITFVNEAYCHIFGQTYDEFIGKNILSFIPPDFVEYSKTHLEQLTPDNLFISLEHPSMMPDGTNHWYQWYDQAILNDKGEIIEYQSVGRDIHERKQAEEAMKEEHVVLQTLIDAIPDYIFVKDREGRFIISNKAHTDASSVLSLDDLIGKTAKDVFPDALATQFDDDDEEVMSLQQSRISMERRTVDSDGNDKWVSTTKVPLLDENGDVKGLVGISRDITERKQAEYQMQENEEKFQVLFKMLPVGVFILNKDREIIEINPALEDMLDMTLADIDSDTYLSWRYIHWDGSPMDQSEFASARALNEQRAILDVEIGVIKEDDTVIWTSVNAAPIAVADWSAVVVATDITRRKEAEDQMRENEEKFQVLFKMLPVGVSLLNHDGKIVEMNPALERILEMPLADIALEKYKSRRYIHSDGSPMDYSEFASTRALNEQRPIFDVEIGVVKEDDTVIWTSVNAAPIKVADWSAVIVTTDISRRKEAEIAFQNSETRYGRLIEESPFCIHEIGLDKLFISMNPSGLAMINADSEEDIIGTPCLDVVATKDRERIDALMDEAIKGKDIFVEFETAGDSPRIFSSNFIPIKDENGTVQKLMGITQDITERKQAEIALYESEAKYRDLVETSQGLIWRVDLEGRFTYLNPIYEELTGFRLDEMLGRNFFEFQDAEVLTGDIESFQAILQGQPILGFETILKTKSGDQIDLIANAKPLYDIDGNVMGIQGTAQDITERKQAEIALYESEAKYRDLVETSQGLIWRIDTEGHFTYLNPAWKKTFGYKLDEMIGHSFVEFGDSDILEKNKEIFSNVLQGNMINGFETYLISNVGQIVNLVANAKPQYDADGNTIGIQGTAYNITERKQAEVALQESEAKYRDLVETSQGLIWRANLEGRFTYLNPACEETFGYPIEEMLGQLFTALEDPEMSAKNIEMFSSVLAGNTITGAETKFLTKSGESIALLINAKPLYDTDGNVIGTQGTAHDITERKKSELLALDNQHLRTQFQKEQEQTTVIQNIISTLSHDMKTPLAVISLSRDILDQYYDKLSEEKRQAKLDTIAHQLQFAIQLLNDTVQVARGAHVFQPSLVNLATLCEISIHEWYMGQTDNHDLIFINIGQIENVIIDETLVSRILLNLLSNAVKYSPDGGEIRLELDYYDDGIELRLTDHGIGISEEDLPNIFDLLYRANNVKNILGTGLGLNIAKDCVDRHNGIITVQSELGKGSTFTVKIPTVSEADADTTT